MEQSAQSESGSTQTVEQTIATPTVASGVAGPVKPAPTVQSPFHAAPKEDAGWIRWMVFLIIFIVVAMGAAYLEYNNKYNQPAPEAPVVAQNIPTPTIDPVNNWETHTNTQHNVTLKYPTNWQIKEESEDEAYTVVLQSPEGLGLTVLLGPSGVGGRCNDDPSIIVGLEKTTVVGKQLTIFYEGNDEQDIVNTAYLLDSETPCPNIAFIDITDLTGVKPGTPGLSLASISMKYADEKPRTLEEFISEDVETAKKILETLKIEQQTIITTTPADTQVVCTQEAKLCTDGSYVSRTGPNCEFAACPGQ